MNLPLSFNKLQTALAIMQPKRHFFVAGRAFGKSTYFGYMLWLIQNYLPGASGIISAKSYTHILTAILPTAFDHLERMGYHRDVHYVVGVKPPNEAAP